MRNYLRRWPQGVFEDNNGTVVPVTDVYVSLTAATNNQSIVSAVSGKQIIALGIIASSQGLATQINLKNGSGGTVRSIIVLPANTVADPNVILPFDELGWMRTDSGVALVADCGAVAANISVRYITA